MGTLKRVFRLGTIEEIRSWILKSRPPGSRVVMDARYWVLMVPEKGRVAAVGLRRLSWFATELKHVVVSPSERRQGYGREILHLALERVRTPLTIATVRAESAHWVRVLVEEGFRKVERLGSEGNEVLVLVRRTRGAGEDPPPEPPAPLETSGNT
jgi:GNAT superfamily N-acetyltransferase